MAMVPTERDVVAVARGGRGMCQCGCAPWWAAEGLGTSQPTQRGKGPAAQRTDDQIKSSVEAMLTDDPWLDASNVYVGVQKSVVTLTGNVATRADKRRAEDLADRVRGVRDVQNQLQIPGPQPTTAP